MTQYPPILRNLPVSRRLPGVQTLNRRVFDRLYSNSPEFARVQTSTGCPDTNIQLATVAGKRPDTVYGFRKGYRFYRLL